MLEISVILILVDDSLLIFYTLVHARPTVHFMYNVWRFKKSYNETSGKKYITFRTIGEGTMLVVKVNSF